MIFGIGIDIIEVARIEKQIEAESNSFVNKIFTDNEVRYCETKIKNKAQNYAARFAAKEAFFKALGTGWRDGLSWKDIEIENDDLGKPSILLTGKSKQIIQENNISTVHVSLSHIREIAVAVVILEMQDKNINMVLEN
ncbi:holo-ACP synthase [candidate division KSB1 bacterium]|nr:holo-ACP synthase [candidate division KSB1 bacterium]